MRGKRSKQYRKLMGQYSMTFGFREPYQVLVDAEMVTDACRFKMELAPALERTVHGKVKPMITQCEIRKLYARKKEPGIDEAIEVAKTLERRRCGHHPDEYPEPLPTEECMESVVDPKNTGTNKHRYVVASQDQSVRRMLRGVRGTPLIYIKRSVMILEPMADESAQVRAREEKSKFRAEIKKPTGKRKRDPTDEGDEDDKEDGDAAPAKEEEEKKKKKVRAKGPKGPNPLAVKKAKATKPPSEQNKSAKKPEGGQESARNGEQEDAPAKRKRRRKSRAKTQASEDSGAATATTAEPATAEAGEA